MLGLQRLASKLVSDPSPALGDFLQRQIRRVAAIAPRREVLSSGVNAFKQRIDRNASPVRAQLRPLGDAVNVDCHAFRRKRQKLLPRPRDWFVDSAMDRETPLIERRVW